MQESLVEFVKYVGSQTHAASKGVALKHAF